MQALIVLSCLVFLLVGVQGFRALPVVPRGLQLSMGKISNNVEFDTVAREWRMKWSPDNDKKALESAQVTLSLFRNAIKRVPGVKSVQRIVCGGCHDFKVIVAVEAEKFADWEAAKFAPEEEFLAAIKAVQGISQIETQTYTIMPVE